MAWPRGEWSGRELIATVRDQRAGVRISMRLRALVRWRTRAGRYRAAWGKIANISGNGFLMKVPIRLRQQTPITCTVFLPNSVTTVPIELTCQGRVVRRTQLGKAPGLGATIEDYQLRPAAKHASALV